MLSKTQWSMAQVSERLFIAQAAGMLALAVTIRSHGLSTRGKR